jgi:hypothetical protein
MGPVERFTRDAASKYVWASCMVLAILALVLTFTRGGDAVDAERLASQRRAVDAVAEVVEPRVSASDPSAPITEQQLTSLRDAVERSILSDPRVVRVRIWSDDGRLWFSTDRNDRLGSQGAFNDEFLEAASTGRTITRSNLSDDGAPDELNLLRTYLPLGSNAVAEVDQTTEGTVAPVEAQWRGYQLTAGALALLFLFLTVLSLRDPIERINTGVGFAPSAIPAGYSLIDDERLHAVEEVYRLAHDRVARLEGKLAESEAARRRLEGDIQRALTKAHLETPKPSAEPARAPEPPAPSRVSPPAPAMPPATEPAAAATNGDGRDVIERAERPAAAGPSVEPEVVKLPESTVLGGEGWAASAQAGPLARATREDTSRPELQPKPVAPKPKRASRLRRKSEAKSEPRSVASAAPTATSPAAAPVVIPPAEPEKPKRASRLTRKPDPVPVVPDSTVSAPDIDDAKAHEAALETFIRLTESDRQHEDAEVDQGAVRAALARTAARKKPGGQRLQPHEGERGESPGGPPSREAR